MGCDVKIMMVCMKSVMLLRFLALCVCLFSYQKSDFTFLGGSDEETWL